MTMEQDQALVQLGQFLRSEGYRFVTPTPLTHARVNERAGSALATDLAGVFGWSRPFARDLLSEPVFRLMEHAEVLEASGPHWRSRVRLSSLDGQLFLHSSFPTEAADAVFFGPDTYRFVSAMQTYLGSRQAVVRRVVDIGCGSGAAAILAALALPEAEVLALDINPSALRLTNVNAELAGVRNLKVVQSDLLSAVEGEFDLLLANPPYLVDPHERTYRHGGGPLGAGLSLRILNEALDRMAPDGCLLLYTGVAMHNNQDPFLREVERCLRGRPLRWRYRELDPDVFGEELLTEPYAGCDRIAAVVLEVTKPA